jgi:hypothetical protein
METLKVSVTRHRAKNDNRKTWEVTMGFLVDWLGIIIYSGAQNCSVFPLITECRSMRRWVYNLEQVGMSICPISNQMRTSHILSSRSEVGWSLIVTHVGNMPCWRKSLLPGQIRWKLLAISTDGLAYRTLFEQLQMKLIQPTEFLGK